jgi:hypothetical protein
MKLNKIEKKRKEKKRNKNYSGSLLDSELSSL